MKIKPRFQLSLGIAFLICQFANQSLLTCVQAKAVMVPSGRKLQIGIPEDIEAGVHRAADRLELLYPLLPPKLGAYLSNPNLVLLMADERGLSDVVFRSWSESDVKDINKFNELASKYGFRIGYKKDENIAGATQVDGWFENLAGYERVSERSKLPGIDKFEASTGWKGLDQWETKTIKALEDCAAKGDYPAEYASKDDRRIVGWFNTVSNATSLLNGVAFGYPDTAVMPTKSKGQYIGTKIAYSDFYLGNEPNYLYYDDADMKTINAQTKRWGTLLGEFYHCPQYLKLAHDPEFAKAREIADKFK